MAINQKRMGGRFMVTPFEVYDLLQGLPLPCTALYMSILRFQYIREDWESSDTWVVGYVKATKTELFTKAPIGEGTFYRTAWPQLIDAGLLDVTPETEIIIPMLKKKADVGVSPSDIAELRSRVEQLEDLLDGSQEDPEGSPEKGGQPENEAKASAAEGKASAAEGKPSAAEASSCARESLLEDLDQSRSNEEEAQSSFSRDRQEKRPKILTFRGKSQENFLTEPYKELMAELDTIWPGRGAKLPHDAEYLVALNAFPEEALAEALQAAKDNQIKYGNYDWILNRLHNPELFIGGKKRKKKSQERDPDIGRLECDWLRQ